MVSGMVIQDAAYKSWIQACRGGDTESSGQSGAAVASVVKLMGWSGWLELARPLSCSTIRSRTLSLIASIYTASTAAGFKERLSRGPWHLELETKVSPVTILMLHKQ